MIMCKPLTYLSEYLKEEKEDTKENTTEILRGAITGELDRDRERSGGRHRVTVLAGIELTGLILLTGVRD